MRTFGLSAALLAILVYTTSVSVHAFDEWQNVNYDDLGITQAEYQRVKESGMSKAKLLELLEYGIMPNEYFSQPWKKLGVSEQKWISEKKAGMEDDDIDRRYRRQAAHNYDPFVSFVLPGYYQYKTGEFTHGGILSGIAVTGLMLTFLHTDRTGSIYPIYPITALVSALWSAGNAYMDTRYQHNEDASRFSLDFGPLPSGAAARFIMRY